MVRANVRNPLRPWVKGQKGRRRRAFKTRRAAFRRKRRGIGPRAVRAIVKKTMDKRTETKSTYEIDTDEVTSDVPFILSLTSCIQGDASNERDGSSVFGKAVSLSFRIDLDVANHSRDVIRYMVVMFPDGHEPTNYADVLAAATYPDYYTSLYRSKDSPATAGDTVRYRILCDDLEVLDTEAGRTTVYKKIHLKINKFIEWDKTSSTDANPTKNRIYLFVMGQHASTNDPSDIYVQHRFYFKDN